MPKWSLWPLEPAGLKQELPAAQRCIGFSGTLYKAEERVHEKLMVLLSKFDIVGEK